MSRPNQPWWWKARKSWYVWVDGVQVKLDPDRDLAYRKWYEIKAGVQPHPTEVCCSDVLDAFLTSTDATMSTDHANYYRRYVVAFVAEYPRVPVTSLSRDHLTAFVEKNKHRWKSPSTRSLAGSLVCRFGHWLVEAKYVATYPFLGYKVGGTKSRGADRLPTRPTVDALLATCTDAARDVLVAVLDTGCRPIDATRVTAREFSARDRVWVLTVHKTAKKTGRPKVVHLTDRVVEACQKRSSRHPTGPLFRTSTDKPWNTNLLARTLDYYVAKSGVDRFTLYALRHLFATDALERGVPDAVVAELLGHSVQVLHRHYAHLVSRTATLKDALDKVRGRPDDPRKTG
jgi:integrase